MIQLHRDRCERSQLQFPILIADTVVQWSFENRVKLNSEKTTIGLISKKKTLLMQGTFFVHFFAVVLHDYNVKLPETS